LSRACPFGGRSSATPRVPFGLGIPGRGLELGGSWNSPLHPTPALVEGVSFWRAELRDASGPFRTWDSGSRIRARGLVELAPPPGPRPCRARVLLEGGAPRRLGSLSDLGFRFADSSSRARGTRPSTPPPQLSRACPFGGRSASRLRQVSHHRVTDLDQYLTVWPIASIANGRASAQGRRHHPRPAHGIAPSTGFVIAQTLPSSGRPIQA